MTKIYEIVVKNPKITSEYGNRVHPISGKYSFHAGLDLVSKNKDTNLYAIDNGYVQKVVTGQDKSKTGYGNYIWVRYPNYDLSLLHAHCKKINFKKGDEIKKGDVVAIMGTTGASTGVHLHLGMTRIGSDAWLNPKSYSILTEVKKNYNGILPKLPSRGYFKNGDRGTEVEKLQKFLNWANDGKNEVDGIIGKKTLAEVGKYQKNFNLKIDKLFGKKCLSKAKTIKK